MTFCAYPKAQLDAHKESIEKAIKRVLDSGIFILGSEVREFEKEFRDYIGGQFGVGVANGTDAISICLRALKIGPGDEVITVSHTAVATVSAIELCGATPVLVDIDPLFYTIDPACLRSSITSRTKAIIPVHIYGQSADMDPILEISKEFDIPIIEDCAQAHGARYKGKKVGTMGALSAFSFYPTKNLGAIGDGGFCISNQADLNERLDIIRQYGWKERYISHIPGMNSRLDEIQAAILREKLKHLDSDNQKRRNIANLYFQGLAGLKIGLPNIRKDSEHVFHLFVIELERRNELMEHLKSHDIHPLIHYPVPIHKQEAYVKHFASINLPNTEKAAQKILSLPIYPELDHEVVRKIIDLTRKFLT